MEAYHTWLIGDESVVAGRWGDAILTARRSHASFVATDSAVPVITALSS